jgi:signal transduction histidine kinase/DNA-binding response OmpR family regulator/CHASE1-domain containing sensor protein/HPt (histidine-containing phosphotransfer) domain-containing protein
MNLSSIIKFPRRYLPIALTIVIGSIFSGLGFVLVDQLERQQQQQEFERLAITRVTAIEEEIEQSIEMLSSINGLYDASNEVSRSEFSRFVDHFIAHNPSIQAIEWIPRITISERLQFEKAAQANGYPKFEIWEQVGDGLKVRAGDRPEYFPVYYMEPYQGNESALGFDLASNPTRQAALNQARDTGLTVATGRIKLVQETGDYYGFLLFQPIYDKNAESLKSLENRRQALQGFAAGEFWITQLVEDSLTKFTEHSQDLNIYIYDESVQPPEILDVYIPDRDRRQTFDIESNQISQVLGQNHPYIYSRIINVADRKWRIVCLPNSQDFEVGLIWTTWVASGAILLFTLLLCLYFWTNINRTAKIENLVKKRTEELSQTNESLQKEVSDRQTAQEKLRQSEAAIRELYKITTVRETKVEQRLQELLVMGCHWFNMEIGLLTRIKDDENLDGIREYEVILAHAPHNLITPGDVFILNNTYCRETINSSEPVEIKTTTNDWFRHPAFAGSYQLPVRSYVGAKIMVGGSVYGTLSFSSSAVNTSSSLLVNQELLQLMTQWVGSAIERKLAANELETARDRALEATRTKSEFLATMSHEIRTPMNGVIGMTSLLLETPLSEQQKDWVETIRISGDALLTIINDILDFSKIESGKLDLEYHPFDLRSCIEDALKLFTTQAAEKKIELSCHVEPSIPYSILGDSTRTRQILVNLLGNAVKFTEKGEVIVFVTNQLLKPDQNRSGDRNETQNKFKYEIKFAVKDTGIGIPADKLDRLFQPFSQVDSSTTRKYGGTGLGLIICKRLSEMMGGSMWVETEIGRGSTFYFKMIAEEAEAIPPAYLQTQQPHLDGKRVLIVDDNATNRKVISLQLESWKIEVIAVTSGIEALTWMTQIRSRSNQLDLAILDMQMPEMDGLTLAEKIRQIPDYQQLPLVILSSLGTSPTEVNTKNLNLSAFLSKPIKQSHLYDVLLKNFADESPLKLEEQKAEPTIDSTLGQNNPLRILLAEDNVVNQKVALNLLSRLGYRADVAANGLEVLEALRRQDYDVILMDMQMPEMDGLEATSQIYQQWDNTDIPHIIALTANAMAEDRQRCLDAGMHDYLSKPIRLEELSQVLQKCRVKKPVETTENIKISADIVKTGTTTIMNKDSKFANNYSVESEAEQPAIDSMVLQALGDPIDPESAEFILDLIDSYLEDAPPLLAEIISAVEDKDLESLEHSAHTLKSICFSLGAMQLGEFCKQLEFMGRKGEPLPGEASSLGDRVKAEYERVQVALAGERQKYMS